MTEESLQETASMATHLAAAAARAEPARGEKQVWAESSQGHPEPLEAVIRPCSPAPVARREPLWSFRSYLTSLNESSKTSHHSFSPLTLTAVGCTAWLAPVQLCRCWKGTPFASKGGRSAGLERRTFPRCPKCSQGPAFPSCCKPPASSTCSP